MTDYLSKQTSNLIKTKKNSKKPFFITLAYNAPHNPLQAKKSDYFDDFEVSQIKDHNQRVYGAMIKSIDRGVGLILNALKKANKYENTVVVFTSDQGAPHYLGFFF
jgi:uncharacterized sulfatase